MAANILPPTQQTGNQIKLSVGEKSYEVSRDTLEKSKRFKDEILKANKTEYFLDRDGQLFGNILKYLRTGTIQFPEGFQQREELKKEAEYFQLEHLTNALESGAGTTQVVKLLVLPTKRESTQYKPPIYEIMPIGWSWGDLEKTLPPIKYAMIDSAIISLNDNHDYDFSFKGSGNTRTNDYLSDMVRDMPWGGLQIKILDPIMKTSVLDKLMAKHGFNIIGSTFDPIMSEVSQIVEEIILCRIKPVTVKIAN